MTKNIQKLIERITSDKFNPGTSELNIEGISDRWEVDRTSAYLSPVYKGLNVTLNSHNRHNLSLLLGISLDAAELIYDQLQETEHFGLWEQDGQTGEGALIAVFVVKADGTIVKL